MDSKAFVKISHIYPVKISHIYPRKHGDLESSLNETKTTVDNFEVKCDDLRQALHKKQVRVP